MQNHRQLFSRYFRTFSWLFKFASFCEQMKNKIASKINIKRIIYAVRFYGAMRCIIIMFSNWKRNIVWLARIIHLSIKNKALRFMNTSFRLLMFVSLSTNLDRVDSVQIQLVNLHFIAFLLSTYLFHCKFKLLQAFNACFCGYHLLLPTAIFGSSKHWNKCEICNVFLLDLWVHSMHAHPSHYRNLSMSEKKFWNVKLLIWSNEKLFRSERFVGAYALPKNERFAKKKKRFDFKVKMDSI